MQTDGTWLGHGGSVNGQYMLAHPETRTVVVYFSANENSIAPDPDPAFQGPLVETMAEIAAQS